MAVVMSVPAGSASEPKIVLLVRLLNAIDEGVHAFEDLKDRIAENGKRPSTRSLRRYLAILSEAGFPWYFDRNANAYRFAGGYSLKRLDLSSGELFGLVALRSLGASIGGTIGASIDEVTEKLVGTAGRSAQARVDAPSSVAFRVAEVGLDGTGERAFSLLSSAERASGGLLPCRLPPVYGDGLCFRPLLVPCSPRALRRLRASARDRCECRAPS